MKKLILLLLFMPYIAQSITSKQAQDYYNEFKQVGIYNPERPGDYNEERAQFILKALSEGFCGMARELELLQTNARFQAEYAEERKITQQLRRGERQLRTQNEELVQNIIQRDAQARRIQQALTRQQQETEAIQRQLDEERATSQTAIAQMVSAREKQDADIEDLQRQLAELPAQHREQLDELRAQYQRQQEIDQTSLRELNDAFNGQRAEVERLQEELTQQQRTTRETLQQQQQEFEAALAQTKQTHEADIEARQQLADNIIERIRNQYDQRERNLQDQLQQQATAHDQALAQLRQQLTEQQAQSQATLVQQRERMEAAATQARQEADAQFQQDIAAIRQQLEEQIAQTRAQEQQACSTQLQEQKTSHEETISEMQRQTKAAQTAQQQQITELERQRESAVDIFLENEQTISKLNARVEELQKRPQSPTLPPAPTQDDATKRILEQRVVEFERQNAHLQTQLTQAQTQLDESSYARRGQEELIDKLRKQISQQAPAPTDPGKGKERQVDSSTYGSRRADAKQAAATLLKKHPQERTLVGHPLFSTLDLDQGTPTLIRFGDKKYQLNNPANPALVKIDKSHLVDVPAGQTTDGAPMSEEQKQRYASEEKQIKDTSLTLSQSLSPEQLQYFKKMASEAGIKEEGLCGDEFKKNGTIILFATHGTWSNKAAFGGDIKTISTYNIFKFACQLAAAKKMRVKVVSVSWSGALSLPDRKSKARELANYCKKLWETEAANIKETWMIGHSHGCNVSAMAANHLFDETKRLVDVGILLACPALDVPRPLDFNITYAFYAQGDFTQAAGSAQGRYNLNRKLPWAQPGSGRKVYNIRVMLNGYDMDHVSIKWGVMPHLAKILTYIDTYYPTYYDLELNVENHPNSLPLIAIRHQEQKSATNGTALAENARVREDFTRKYKRDMSKMGIQYISGVTWLFNLAREGLSAWKGEPEIGAGYLTELPGDAPEVSSSSSSSAASSSGNSS